MVDWRMDINIVGLSDCVASVGRLELISRIRWPNEFLTRAAEIVKTNIEDRTPVKSGKLKASWYIDEGPDYRKIGSTENYGQFQNDGTKPSPGRYVKAIDRRLVNPRKTAGRIGWHPGVPATHFFDNALADADREIDVWFTEFANGIGWS